MVALSGLASLLAGKGDIAGAIQLLKRAAEASSNPELTGRLAELYEQNGDYCYALLLISVQSAEDEDVSEIKHRHPNKYISHTLADGLRVEM